MVISLIESTPVGSTIVAVDIVVFVIFAIMGIFVRGVRE